MGSDPFWIIAKVWARDGSCVSSRVAIPSRNAVRRCFSILLSGKGFRIIFQKARSTFITLVFSESEIVQYPPSRQPIRNISFVEAIRVTLSGKELFFYIHGKRFLYGTPRIELIFLQNIQLLEERLI